jgi:putative ABC transport system substrate-binding protein
MQFDQLNRREFMAAVCGVAVAWPLGARAQPPSKIYRLGYLGSARIPYVIEALQAGLRDLGYVESRNLKIEYRFGGSLSEALDALAAELVALAPDAVVTTGTPATLAAKRATTTIPIVMAPIGDPLRAGIVVSLAHPGGNITGVSLYGSELSGKRVEVLKETLSGITRLAVLGNATNPFNQYMWEDTQPAARQLGIEPQLFMVRESEQLAGAFGAMRRTGADAVIVLSDAMFNRERRQIADLAAEHRLPAMYEDREYVKDGGLMSYGPNVAEVTRHSATLVDKVLKGAKPADLPIELPEKFDLVINLKTAAALGIDVPLHLQQLADEVIE